MILPDDMFKQKLLQYLTVDDIVKLDNACMNYNYRSQLLDKISGVILLGDNDKDISMKASLFKWLGMRRINLINMDLLFKDEDSFSSSIENDYVDQFSYTQYLVMRGSVRNDMVVFIISHCPFLLSIDISYDDISSSYPQVTLQSIEEHCTGLQSLSLNRCHEITDTGLMSISKHSTNLESLKINYCSRITDASIISISTHCTGLQSLNLDRCHQITDASIISISTYCTGLQSLNLGWCTQITDASIISISTYFAALHSLCLEDCRQITDASIISISKNCTRLKYLHVKGIKYSIRQHN